MKVLRKLFFLILCVYIFTGCSKDNSSNVVKKVIKKVEGINSYHLNGVLEIINNENSYLYDVDVSYLKENNFKVSLKNQTNNHEQIILRNSDGVYVLTPSLNKSFKFQSEWPYNNSQSYLLHNIINDIKNDNEYVFEKNGNDYIVTTKVNYSNNKELVKQKVYINKDNDIYLIEVIDSNNIVKLKMSINSIDYNNDINIDYFKLENSLSVSTIIEDSVSKIDDIVYPMYIPQNTYLSNQDKVSLENGERVILTFAGDYPFMLIQETVDLSSSSVVSVFGEPLQLSDSIGIIDDSSVTWICDGIEYYLVSNSLDKTQLVDIANSMTVAAIEK